MTPITCNRRRKDFSTKPALSGVEWARSDKRFLFFDPQHLSALVILSGREGFPDLRSGDASLHSA